MKENSYIFAAAQALFGWYYDYSQKHIDVDFWEKYIKNVSKNFLITFGANLSSKGENNTSKFKDNKYSESMTKTLRSFEMVERYKDIMSLYIDSGGYQVQVNQVLLKDLPKFLTNYSDFLINNIDYYDYAFALDLIFASGPNANYKTLLNLNNLSYKVLANLPEEVRKKILYIYHYKTPKTLDIFERLYSKFGGRYISNYWSLSASVAYIKHWQTKNVPYVVSILGVIIILNNAIKKGIKDVKIHFLAGCGFTDILLYKIVQKHVKEIYDINLHITFDSSAAFKQFLVSGNASAIFKGKVTNKIDLRMTEYRKEQFSGYSNERVYKEFIQEMASTIDSNYVIPDQPLYVPKEDKPEEYKMNDQYRFWGVIHLMYFYRKFESICIDRVENNYDKIKNFDFSFVYDLIMQVSGGVGTEGKIQYTNKIGNTLSLLKNVNGDTSEVKSIIGEYLGRLEILNDESTYDFTF